MGGQGGGGGRKTKLGTNEDRLLGPINGAPEKMTAKSTALKPSGGQKNW